MAVNSFFHTNNLAALKSEQNLYRDLIKEAIQIHGHDVYYVDRTTVAIDTILGEDAISKFTTQHPIEMYVEDAEGGYAGEKEIMSQFGLENRNEITFVVSKQRFQEMDSQITLEDGTDTTGGSIQLEAGSINQNSNSSRLETVTQRFITMNGTDISSSNAGDNIMLEDDNTSFILSEESGSEFYLIMDTATTDADRPQEGDLVYHPVFAKMFEINFVDHDEPFYQLDNNPVYKLRCKQFEYASEVMDTGIATIDAIEGDLSTDARAYQITLENEVGSVLLENAADTGTNSYIITEDYIVGDYVTDKTSQNELFDQLDDTVLDFTESNPFGDVGSAT